MCVEHEPHTVTLPPARDGAPHVHGVVQVAHVTLGTPADALVIRARVGRLVRVGLDDANVRAVAVGRLEYFKFDAVASRERLHARSSGAKSIRFEPAELPVLREASGRPLEQPERVILGYRAAAQLVG